MNKTSSPWPSGVVLWYYMAIGRVVVVFIPAHSLKPIEYDDDEVSVLLSYHLYVQHREIEIHSFTVLCFA